MTSQYQNKQVSESGILRPKYGVIRGIHLGGSSNKKFVIYNGTDATGRKIQTISYPNSPISQHDLNIPFDSLYVDVSVEDGASDDESALTILVD